MYFFISVVRPCMHHNYGMISESHACRDCVWPIILDAQLYTTCPGGRGLVVIRFNVTFLHLRPCYEQMCRLHVSRKMQKVFACFDAVRVFISILILWTLQSQFTLWLKARMFQCRFEDACRPQRTHTSPGIGQGWTLFLNMQFLCPSLDVVFYQVLGVSEQVSVILWSYHQRRYKTFCVC